MKLLSGGFGVTGNFAKQDSILKNEIKNDIMLLSLSMEELSDI
jgi:hypothetical protein